MPNIKKTVDILIKNELVFDGTGAPPAEQDVAIKDGIFVAKALDLEPSLAREVIDEGYIGFPTNLLPTHYLANDPHIVASLFPPSTRK